MLRDIAHIHAVHEDLSLADVKEARHQIDQRRLAAAGAADEGRGRSALGRKAQIMEHILLGAWIAERHMAEFHHSFLGLIKRLRLTGILDGRLGVQHFIDAVCCNGCTRKHDRHHRDHHERHDDLHRILHIRHHIADLHHAGVHLM